MSLAPHLASGRHAEDMALDTLSGDGSRLLVRNYRCPQGEIDLVMLEVRFRRARGFGDAADSVDTRKQHKLLQAAQHFLLQDARYRRRPLRFDVVAVSEGADRKSHTDWIKDAFCAD